MTFTINQFDAIVSSLSYVNLAWEELYEAYPEATRPEWATLVFEKLEESMLAISKSASLPSNYKKPEHRR